MNLDSLRDMRSGVAWATCRRAVYKLDGKLDTYTIHCWTNHVLGPVLDADDINRLQWTAVNPYVADDGALIIGAPENTARRLTIKPIFFQDAVGGMHIGWPMAGYVNPADGERWRRVSDESEELFSSSAVNRLSREFTNFGSFKRPIATPIVEVPKSDDVAPTTLIEEKPMPEPTPESTVESVSEPLTNGPAHISGTFVVHLSDDEVDDLVDDVGENDRPMVKDGRVYRTRIVSIRAFVEAAAEKVSPRYADLVADFDTATVDTEDDGLTVTFIYDLDI